MDKKKIKKAIILISSGLDSPVSAYLAKEKGLDMIGFFFDQKSNNSLQKVRKLARKLSLKQLYVADHLVMMKEFSKHNSSRFTCVLCKRFMYRIVSRFAKKKGIPYIMDGANLGQVASQTKTNIVLTAEVSEVPLLRPLLGFDKQDIVDIARKIGTFEISSEKEQGCKFVPRYPAINTNKNILLREEQKIDVENIIKKTTESIKKEVL